MTYDRMGRQENGLTATILARGSRECGMEVWRGGAQAAIGCGQKGSITRSYCDLIGGLRFAGHSPGLQDTVLWCFAEKWSMHVCANKHAHPTTASIDPCCRETHYITR